MEKPTLSVQWIPPKVTAAAAPVLPPRAALMAPPPPSGVRQVTWQRSFKDESIENLATFSSRFGQEVNAAYQGKVEFTRAALNSTSIRLRSVSWEDESCYICLFNMYPDGSKRKHTCLTVTGESLTQGG